MEQGYESLPIFCGREACAIYATDMSLCALACGRAVNEISYIGYEYDKLIGRMGAVRSEHYMQFEEYYVHIPPVLVAIYVCSRAR